MVILGKTSEPKLSSLCHSETRIAKYKYLSLKSQQRKGYKFSLFSLMGKIFSDVMRLISIENRAVFVLVLYLQSIR